jgi:acyl-CoA thioesterase-2
MAELENLIDTLALERIEVNLFRGLPPKDSGPRIFGGFVIAQALLAAYRTVHERVCHSIHCYFLRPGDPSVPILYEVDRARDGRTFVARRVTAIQHGEQIFNLAGSFQTPESGLEHQDPMPDTPSPDTLADDQDWRRAAPDLPPEARALLERPRPIQLRSVEPWDPAVTGPLPPYQRVWMRAIAPLGDDLAINQAVLAYASDMGLLWTAGRPHGLRWAMPNFQSASIDHAIWFHRPSNFNDWHLYSQHSPSASGARGMNFGAIFSQDGRLVASTAQEGLMRRRQPRDA